MAAIEKIGDSEEQTFRSMATEFGSRSASILRRRSGHSTSSAA